MTREVMQQALEALKGLFGNSEKWESGGVAVWRLGGSGAPRKAITALEAALAQPEQEPVAYYHPHKGFYWAKPTHISAPTVVDVPPVPLYVKWKAAHRPWQGLTDQDRNACLVSADPCEALADPEAKQLMEDVEAALRSKNT